MTQDKRPSRRPGPGKGSAGRPKRAYGSGEKREERAPRREGSGKFDPDRPVRKSGAPRKSREEGDERRPPRREGEFKRDKEFKPRRPRAEGEGERRPPRREGDFKRDKEFKPRRPRAEGEGERRPPRRESEFKGDKEFKPRRPRAEGDGERRPPRREGEFKGDKEFKPRRPRAEGDGERRPPREGSYKAYREERPKRSGSGPRENSDDRPKKRGTGFREKSDKPFDGRSKDRKERGKWQERQAPRPKKYTGAGKKEGDYIPKALREEETIRLNKFIANSGVCSRREADELIKAGTVTVNGKVVTELGTKIKASDKIVYGGELLNSEKKRYLLLNKQKGYVTTTRDPHAKNTVMELIEGACKERIYPVGRLDRNTTGLLLFTNDGELSKKLTHPSARITKLYHVVLDKPCKRADLLKAAEGVELEDGIMKVDSIAYDVTANDKRELGVEIHSGKNRVIRRLFEVLGYDVVRLDRVVFAGLTKKNLPRGTWRFLTEKEVGLLKRL